jgi:hypothetical protein
MSSLTSGGLGDSDAFGEGTGDRVAGAAPYHNAPRLSR